MIFAGNINLDWLPILAVCMMRPLGVFLLLPLFSSSTLATPLIRNSLILMIAIPAVPVYLGSSHLASLEFGHFIGLAITEIMIGTLLGFVAAIPFWAIDMAGFIVDTMRGSSMASIFNPTLNTQSSVFGMFFTQLLSVLFLVTGGFNQLIEAIYQSWRLLPPGAPLQLQQSFVPFFMHAWRTLFDLCINFALPAMVVMILIDVGLGLINRSAKQLNVFFVAMPIKCLIGLLLFVVSLNFALSDYLVRIDNFKEQAQTLIGTLLPKSAP